MNTWFTAADGAQQYPDPTDSNVVFSASQGPGVLHIEPGTGDVQLQRINSSGSWATFETLTQTQAILDLASQPSLRILATGNARFQFRLPV